MIREHFWRGNAPNAVIGSRVVPSQNSSRRFLDILLFAEAP